MKFVEKDVFLSTVNSLRACENSRIPYGRPGILSAKSVDDEVLLGIDQAFLHNRIVVGREDMNAVRVSNMSSRSSS